MCLTQQREQESAQTVTGSQGLGVQQATVQGATDEQHAFQLHPDAAQRVSPAGALAL
jgi:hypothetical protein